ncbi:MAG TPA: sodium-translocating pyrophosphatase [Tangfeifania sp.]|nr:sodium-translocating pyrophosphatase [Tangfeifania sp.]
MSNIFLLVPFASILALIFAWFFFKSMMKNSEGTPRMKEIAQYVREGAMAYLNRQYKVVAIVFAILFVLLIIMAYFKVQNPFVPVAFLTGGFFSGLCGFLGMKTATFASARTAHGASQSLNKGLQVAFRSGAVMGLVVVGFALLDIAAWFWILNEYVYTPDNMANGLQFLGLNLVHAHPEYVTNGLINEAGTRVKLIEITVTMLTFGMGASTQALFARVGGGIYTKAADVGADLVGKVEAGIPEDDPRNPATIADNVGDNVGDVAGMGADLYESYAGSILATAALGASIPAVLITNEAQAYQMVLAPMMVAAIGIILSILGIFMVRTKESATQKTLLNALLLGTGGSSVLILIAMIGLVMIGWVTWGIFWAVVIGLTAGVIIGQATEYFTSDEYKPTKGIAKQAQQGPATTIIDGLAVGMYSTWIPVVTIVLGIMGAFWAAGGAQHFALGVYGIGFAAVGMLSTLGITLATDAFGPIADNAGGNAEMSELDPQVRERTDALDMLGNTTAATGKGFAIGSAALTAMALISAYMEEVRLWFDKIARAGEGFVTKGGYVFYRDVAPAVEEGVEVIKISTASVKQFSAAYDITLFNPLFLGGLFLGAMMAFVFSAMTMKAVGRAAGAMVDEVRRQFKEIKGILDGTAKPEYAKCVEISTKGAQREMMLPSLVAIAVPVIVGAAMGVAGVVGLLAGGLTTGFTLAVFMNNAGGAWDNAKKFIEKGNYGGKGSETHHAGVVGDTVGDPFKDTSGPSLNILIKLMTMVSVVMAGLTVTLSLL